MNKQQLILKGLAVGMLLGLTACGDDPQPAVVAQQPVYTPYTTVPVGQTGWYNNYLTLSGPITIGSYSLPGSVALNQVTWTQVYQFIYNIATTCGSCSSSNYVNTQAYLNFGNILWLNFNHNTFWNSFLTTTQVNQLQAILVTDSWGNSYTMYQLVQYYMYSIQSYYSTYYSNYLYYPTYGYNTGNMLNLGFNYNNGNWGVNVGGFFGF